MTAGRHELVGLYQPVRFLPVTSAVRNPTARTSASSSNSNGGRWVPSVEVINNASFVVIMPIWISVILANFVPLSVNKFQSTSK